MKACPLLLILCWFKELF